MNFQNHISININTMAGINAEAKVCIDDRDGDCKFKYKR